jgi:hypothetical protein
MDLAYMMFKDWKVELTGPVVFSEHSCLKRLKKQEREEVFNSLNGLVDKTDFLLQDVLFTNYGFESKIEPGNDFSEVQLGSKHSNWRLGDNFNNWNSHREEVNLLNLNKKLSGKLFKKTNKKFSRLCDIELTI